MTKQEKANLSILYRQLQQLVPWDTRKLNACGETGAVRPLVEAGTHRNDSGDSLNVAGIHLLQGVEDVK
ncbi:TPA: hypothetical protein ON725_002631 [Proteus mirabilis]|nr:hypothetical protein [Proteus mirabilis]HCT3694859.1 hypothetical protein [Proteus mirabilis]